MITELTLTDTDFQRPLKGGGAANSADSRNRDSGGTFAAILAPMSTDSKPRSTEGNTGTTGSKVVSADADAGTTALGFTTIATEAAERHAGGSIPDAAALPVPGGQAGTLTPGDGKGGKILPPGGNNEQGDSVAESVATISVHGVNLAAAASDTATIGEGAAATALVSEAIAGPAAESAQDRSTVVDATDPVVAASAGTARTAAGVEFATSDAAAPGRAAGPGTAPEGAARDRATLEQLPGDADLVTDRDISGDGLRTASETATQGRGGETANALLPAGAGTSDESSALPERGQVPGTAELRPGDRPLTERTLAELTSADRGPRLAMQQFAGQSGWGEEIQGKLQWLSRQGLQRAELQLHPAELGSIDVRITSENDQTSVVFLAANRSARELLEAELPRLRELFSQVGVELGQVEVSDRQPGDRQQFATRDESYDGDHSSAVKQTPENADTDVGESSLSAVGRDSGRGMIDYYI